MNSFYGETGNRISPLFLVQLAGGVTSIGQKIIKSISKFIKEKKCDMVYGDTDSSFFTNDDKEHFGVTMHLVDKGIDTGEVLYQKKIIISKNDNFVTYPLLQLAEAIPYMKMIITDLLNHRFQKQETGEGSKLWYHPAFWTYLYNYLKKGVK